MHATANAITLPYVMCMTQPFSVTYLGTVVLFDCLRLICGLVLMSAWLVFEEDTTLLEGLAISDIPWSVDYDLPFLPP